MNEEHRDGDTQVDYIAMIKEALEERYAKPRTGWHVTDIAMCPRQRVFKGIDPLSVTDKDLNIYSSGRAIHEAVQWLFMGNPQRFEKERYVEYNGIEGSIDIYDKKRNVPIEFKTYRSSNIDKPKGFQEQLRYYMAMQNSPIGFMVYQCLMHFGNSPWKQFKIIMTDQQRKEQLEKLVREIKSLQNAVMAKDPSLVRGVYSDKEMKWLCGDCPYVKECETMRAGPAA